MKTVIQQLYSFDLSLNPTTDAEVDCNKLEQIFTNLDKRPFENYSHLQEYQEEEYHYNK